jgi:fermentation-respiration switch protein FrsA (DUF1100 family)
MLKLLPRLALAGLAFYAALCALMFAVQRSLEFVPDTSRPDAAKAGIPGLLELELPTGQGIKLLAWYLPPKPGQPVIAYFHGNGGNLSNRIPRLRLFAAAGWGSLMVEYPGFGGNPGRPTERGFNQAALTAITYLQNQGVPANRLVIYGESIGTGVATRVAAGRRCAALILEAPFTSITAVAERTYPWLPVRWLLLDRFDQASRIAGVTAPILIIQGTNDVVVPPALGRALFNAAPAPKRLWIAPGGGHDNLMEFGAWPRIVDFVNQAISGTPMLPPSAVETAG